jgi:hypothetical protein
LGDANGGFPRGELGSNSYACADTVPDSHSYAEDDTVPDSYSYAEDDTVPDSYSYAEDDTVPDSHSCAYTLPYSRFQRHASVECESPDQRSRDQHHRLPTAFGISQRSLHAEHQCREHNFSHGVQSD